MSEKMYREVLASLYAMLGISSVMLRDNQRCADLDRALSTTISILETIGREYGFETTTDVEKMTHDPPPHSRSLRIPLVPGALAGIDRRSLDRHVIPLRCGRG
jgi:hypothetical protein